MAYDYVQSLDNVARDRYDAKLQLIGLKECPFRLALSLSLSRVRSRIAEEPLQGFGCASALGGAAPVCITESVHIFIKLFHNCFKGFGYNS